MSIAGIDMTEVTRLTRAGRVTDATVLLKRLLSNGLGPMRSNSGNADPKGCAATLRDSTRPLTHHADDRSETSGVSKPERRLATRERSSTPDASFRSQTVTNAAGSLQYKIYTPNCLVEARAPLVVMLHGCSQNPDDFAAGTRMNELADIYGFFVAYPAQTTSANPSRCWNWYKSSEQIRDRGEPSLIADATRQILAEHPIDPKRVFVAGLSAGGATAAIMGCAYPDIYAGVGVHSGLACGAASDLSSAFSAMRSGAGRRGTRPSSTVPTIVFHGSADRTVGATNADEVLDQVVARSGSTTIEHGTSAAGMAFTRTIRQEHEGRVVSEQWIVEDGGHAWFGGSARGSYTDARDQMPVVKCSDSSPFHLAPIRSRRGPTDGKQSPGPEEPGFHLHRLRPLFRPTLLSCVSRRETSR